MIRQHRIDGHVRCIYVDVHVNINTHTWYPHIYVYMYMYVYVSLRAASSSHWDRRATYPEQVPGDVSLLLVLLGPPPELLLAVALAQHGHRLATVEAQLVLARRRVLEHRVHHALVSDTQLLLNTCADNHTLMMNVPQESLDSGE